MGNYYNIRGKNIYTEVLGKESSPALLYIHGGPGGIGSVDFVKYVGETLSEKFRIIAPDQRGVWRSEEIHDEENISLEDIIEDFEELRRNLTIKKWSVLSHSFGGYLAVLYAHMYPDSIEYMIYENPSFDFSLSERSMLRCSAEELIKKGKVEKADKYLKALNLNSCSDENDRLANRNKDTGLKNSNDYNNRDSSLFNSNEINNDNNEDSRLNSNTKYDSLDNSNKDSKLNSGNKCDILDNSNKDTILNSTDYSNPDNDKYVSLFDSNNEENDYKVINKLLMESLNELGSDSSNIMWFRSENDVTEKIARSFENGAELWRKSTKTRFKLLKDWRVYHDVFRELSEIKKPSLLIKGKYDPITCKIQMEEFMKNPDRKMVMFDKSGHYAKIEESDKFCKVVIDYLLGK